MLHLLDRGWDGNVYPFNRTGGEAPEKSGGKQSTKAPGTSLGGSHRLLEFDSRRISSPFLLMALV